MDFASVSHNNEVALIVPPQLRHKTSYRLNAEVLQLRFHPAQKL
jgi:hypothetical protein